MGSGNLGDAEAETRSLQGLQLCFFKSRILEIRVCLAGQVSGSTPGSNAFTGRWSRDPSAEGSPGRPPRGWQNGAGSLTSVPGPPKVRSTSGQGFLSFLGEGKTCAVSSPCVPSPRGCLQTCLPCASPAPGIINGDSLGLQNKMSETQN